ncbi:MAG: response regulator receiver protein [Rhizobacter sp.]|nr:response regulator receiver protein [Rhizobacter sp.]
MAGTLAGAAPRAGRLLKAQPASARILVATDNADDASQVVRQLSADFDHVRSSVHADRSLEDFEDYKPQVLVLAFDTLEKAQRYYLGLYRWGRSLQHHPHRTVILCGKDEVRMVFNLCKKDYFDDYVLYWPHSHDGSRLAMSVWVACREMMALQAQTHRPEAFLEHAAQWHEEQSLDAPAADTSTVRIELNETTAPARETGVLKPQPAEQATPVVDDSGTVLCTARPLVLVVDDDGFARRLVTRMLESEDWDVSCVGDGQAALEQLARARPDIILMDINLPGMDGLALTRSLKATPSLAQIPIVMMTGDSRRQTLLNSMDVGAAAFVVKPFSRESLTAKLTMALARRKPLVV